MQIHGSQIALSTLLPEIVHEVKSRTPLTEDFISGFDAEVKSTVAEMTISSRGLRVAAIDLLLRFGLPPTEIATRLPKTGIDVATFRSEVMRAAAKAERGTEEVPSDDWKTSRGLGRTATKAVTIAIECIAAISALEKANRDAEQPERDADKKPTGSRRGYTYLSGSSNLREAVDGSLRIAAFTNCAEHMTIFVNGLAKVDAADRGHAVASAMTLAQHQTMDHAEFASFVGLVADAYI